LQYFRHTDWLGSSRLASTPARTLYYDTAYAPYGEDYKGKTGTGGASDLSFTGQNEDTASWMYDFLFREYNQTQGRWLSPDPAGTTATEPASPQTWNRYAYVANMPDRMFDDSGLANRCIFVFGDNNHNGQYNTLLPTGSSAVYPLDGLGLVGGTLSAISGGLGMDTQGLTQLLQQYQGDDINLIGFSAGAQLISNVAYENPSLMAGVVSTTYLSPGLGVLGGADLFQVSNTMSFRGSGIVDYVVTLGARQSGIPMVPLSGTGHSFVKEYAKQKVQDRLNNIGCAPGGGGGGGAGLYGGMGPGWDGLVGGIEAVYGWSVDATVGVWLPTEKK
jgi:RHS repeat-associated protein